jgi:hypothetical protein
MMWLKHNPITNTQVASKQTSPGSYCREFRSFDSTIGVKHRVRYCCT